MEDTDTDKVVKKIKTKTKRIPNIAEELAKNRNNVKGHSPSPLGTASPTVSVKTSTGKLEYKDYTPDVKPKEDQNREEIPSKMSQLKISSLLSSNADDIVSISSSPVPAAQMKTELPVAKVILPTQMQDGSVQEGKDSLEIPGVLIARINSPVNLETGKTNIPELNRSQSTINDNGTINKAAKAEKAEKAEKAKKSKSTSAVIIKPKPVKATKTNSKTTKDAKIGKETKPKMTSKPSKEKTDSTTKDFNGTNDEDKNKSKTKDTKTPLKATTKTGETKTITKTTELKKKPQVKKEASNVSKSATKKEQTPVSKPKTPKKLLEAPQIKSPSLIEVFEREKNTTQPEEPAVILDIPLYSTEDNEYLDENGQVAFNFVKLVRDKFGPKISATADDIKLAKRNLLGQLHETDGITENKTVEEEEEGVIILDDNAEEEDDDEEDAEEDKPTTSPKKKSHPNKGKNLIGKYDTEDPFIDDSELLWEEQRAATKDGFFVYFGPLIEKGHYASFERTNGTMKRGGVKNK